MLRWDLVVEAPQVRPDCPERLPRVNDIQGQVGTEPLRRAQREQVPDEATPVVPDQHGTLDPQLIHQRQYVGGDLLLLPAVRRRPRPPVAGQVRGDDPQPRRRIGEQVAPLVVMLRPAVQRQHRQAVDRSGLGDVEVDAARLDSRPSHTSNRGRVQRDLPPKVRAMPHASAPPRARPRPRDCSPRAGGAAVARRGSDVPAPCCGG